MTFTEVMDQLAQGFEALGAVVLAIGAVWSFGRAGLTLRRSRQRSLAYGVLRQMFGGTLLLGLEILVAADLVRTIAVAPTLSNVQNLGLIVLIRTFLSFSLETEITGMPPWRRGLGNRTGAPHDVSRLPPGPDVMSLLRPAVGTIDRIASLSGAWTRSSTGGREL